MKIKTEEVIVLALTENDELTHIVKQNGSGNITLYQVSRAKMADYKDLLSRLDALPNA